MKSIYLFEPGVVTCAGQGLQCLWRAAVNADNSSIKRIKTLSGAEGERYFMAGVIDDAILINAAGDTKIKRMTEAALLQIDGAIRQSIARYGAERVCVCAGSCDNGAEMSFAAHTVFDAEGKFPAGYKLKMQGAQECAQYIAKKYQITGPVLSFATACSSSATAIMRAAELLLSGEVDAAIAGGADRASDIALLGFNSLEAVSETKSNPFSANRCGITLGDGAAFFLMAREKPACNLDGGRAISLIGMGESSDAHHITAPDETGEYAAAAMIKALEDAMISPADVDYVNLHGTGTRQNDAMESRAMQKVFGECAVKCSSTKSITGHTLGAAGAVEAAVCYAALAMNAENDALLPAQAWDGVADAALPRLDIVKKGEKTARPRVCMTNTFAFGGANASLILESKQ